MKKVVNLLLILTIIFNIILVPIANAENETANESGDSAEVNTETNEESSNVEEESENSEESEDASSSDAEESEDYGIATLSLEEDDEVTQLIENRIL